MKPHILITDDDDVSCQLFAEVLAGEGYHVTQAHSGEEALAQIGDQAHSLLLVDVRMPGMTGLELTRIVRKKNPSLPIVVMTAFGSIETAFEAIREGAYDYISKPMNLEELKKIVSRALAQSTLCSQAANGGPEPDEAEQLEAVIGRSPAMVEVYKTVARVAPTKSTVLILGESGTGKEVIARAIHNHSPRAAQPFVAVDCGSLTETLLESELFGHVRGSFTGAVSEKKGVFEEAQGGTCFLDEIGDISPNMQAKLLRVLQEHEVRRVGGKDWVKVDVRVVAATNKNLEELVAKKAFREDLYYRLKVVSICLPPIRNRPEDIQPLVYHFLRRYCQAAGKPLLSISREAMERLRAYTWPGNIRQLENALEQAIVLSNQPILTLEDLPADVRAGSPSMAFRTLPQTKQFSVFDAPSLDEVKKRYVLYVINRAEGNISHAAKILDIDRRSLYRMLARYKV